MRFISSLTIMPGSRSCGDVSVDRDAALLCIHAAYSMINKGISIFTSVVIMY